MIFGRQTNTTSRFGGDDVAIDTSTATGDDTNSYSVQRCRPSLAQDSTIITFLTDTSMHGVKYIGQENRHWCERSFWLLAFLLGVLSSAYLIHGVWDRYYQTPVIVTFDANEVATSSIPFPAVTICNNNLVSKRLITELKRTLNETSSSDPKHVEAEKQLEFARYLCMDEPEKFSEGESKVQKQNGKRLDDLIAFFVNNTDPCDEMIMNCQFNRLRCNVSSWKPLLTGFGKCCTFNMVPLGLLFKRPNTTDKLHTVNVPTIDAIVDSQYFFKPGEIDSWSKWEPLKQRSAGHNHGLSIVIDSKLDDYYCPVDDFEGIRIHIHSAYEVPDTWEYSSMVPIGKQTHIHVSADITKADTDIREYPHTKRSCYFGNEKQLKFYQPYTRGNCLTECYGDYMASKCGCVQYELPNYHSQHLGKNLCTKTDHSCIYSEETNFYKDLEQICPGCDPLCEEVKYSYQISTANLLSSLQSWTKNLYTIRKAEPEEWSRGTVAVVKVFFDSESTVPKLRKALYGWADLIANTGGILGLCLGFSVLSGIELIYFFTVRAFWKRHDEVTPKEERKSAVSTSLRHIEVESKQPAPRP